MRGSSISFFTRARSAWSDSCLDWCLCIPARCHKSDGIAGQLGTDLTLLELGLLLLPSSIAQSAAIGARYHFLVCDDAPRSRWTLGLIEDEQYQKIGGGYVPGGHQPIQFGP